MRCQADVAEWQSHQRPRRQPSLRDEDRHPTGRQSRAAVVCTPFVCYSAAPRYCAPASVPVRYVVKMSSSCSVHNVRVYSQFEFHRACHRHSCAGMRAECRSERSVHSIGTTVPAFFTFTGSKSRQAATCIWSARMGAAALHLPSHAHAAVSLLTAVAVARPVGSA